MKGEDGLRVGGWMLQSHRDVQPSNLVWSDGVSRWRLTGCESWARKGSDAPLSYSLRYAAPEASTHFSSPALLI